VSIAILIVPPRKTNLNAELAQQSARTAEQL